MNKPQYVGSAKAVIIDGQIVFKLSICLEQFKKAIDDNKESPAMFYSEKSGKHYFKLESWPMKKENQSKTQSHSVKVDDWEPAKQNEPSDQDFTF